MRYAFPDVPPAWAVEDGFKFTKDCLGWEDVQVLNLEGRTLAALAWVVAGFLYELGVTLEWAEVQLVARLGGWVPHKDREPGKIVLTRGLRRRLEMLATGKCQAYRACDVSEGRSNVELQERAN